MKDSPDTGGKTTPDKATAWACLFTNVFTLPGLGTVAGGGKVGYVQAVLSVLGFGLSLLWALGYARAWLATGEQPEGVGPHFWLGLLGVGIYGLAWFWALASSASMLLNAKANGAQPPPRIGK